MEVIRPAGLPLGRLPFSPAIRANGFVFVSGQASTDEKGNIVADSFAGEMRRSIANVVTILEAAGLTLRDVGQVRSYLQSGDDLAEYNTIYRELFQEPYPVRTTTVGCIGTAIRYEIDVVAVDRPPSAS